MKTLLDGCRFQDLINAWRVRLEVKLSCRWARGWVLAKMAATFLMLDPAKVIKFVRDFLRSLDRASLAPGFSVEFLPDGQNFPAKSRLFESLLPRPPVWLPGQVSGSRSFKSRRRAAMRTGSSGMSGLPAPSLAFCDRSGQPEPKPLPPYQLRAHPFICRMFRASAVAGTIPNHSAASLSVQSSR